MEAITVKAKRNRNGNFTFSFPNTQEKELDVIVVSNNTKIRKKKNLKIEDFFGKMEWKGDPIAYQKKIRDEWD